MSKVNLLHKVACWQWLGGNECGTLGKWRLAKSGMSFFVCSVIQRQSLARFGNKTYLNADSYSMLPTPPEIFKG